MLFAHGPETIARPRASSPGGGTSASGSAPQAAAASAPPARALVPDTPEWEWPTRREARDLVLKPLPPVPKRANKKAKKREEPNQPCEFTKKGATKKKGKRPKSQPQGGVLSVAPKEVATWDKENVRENGAVKEEEVGGDDDDANDLLACLAHFDGDGEWWDKRDRRVARGSARDRGGPWWDRARVDGDPPGPDGGEASSEASGEAGGGEPPRGLFVPRPMLPAKFKPKLAFGWLAM